MAITFIQTLYGAEAAARDQDLSAAGRKELLLTQSLPTVNAFVKWMTGKTKSGKVLPKSAIGKVMHYSLDRWDELCANLYDGSLEIDSNLVENAIRLQAI